MLKTSIKDGQGSNIEACVKKTESSKEQALCVNISGISPKIIIPVGAGVTGDRLLGPNSRFSLDGDLVTFEMAVNASPASPADFYINAIIAKDLIVTEIILSGIGNGIKLKNFMNLNSPLADPMEITFKSDNITNSFLDIFATTDMHTFASIAGFDLSVESGGDEMKSTRVISPSLPIRAKDTFGTAATDQDFIRIRVQDNISQLTTFTAYIRGFITEPGEL